MYEYLDKRYALALYEIAEEKGKVEEYMNDLRNIVYFINNNKELHTVIEHPKINTAKKKQIFKKIFKGNIDDELLSFLLILIEKGRILFIEEKLEQMERIYLERHNKMQAEVITVIPLTEIEKENLKKILEKKYDKEIMILEKIDKDIIGGVYLKVGNDVIDDTIIFKLNAIKKSMLSI
ncbi:ATP synthase subunit delta [Clostridium tepidiprofundi DSM 19306]|uniref:ATP synthase subunit delta n=1 Tax=Clostridium tepidiprofundi DSM 19306 TaxID=1121338 RepID=A0A151B570_9CLOT|nr:F0F1 ATP synthase subunit delta [Clostridium tepidiprofundi]KYH34912.1 ATP synthase subunit delta [Clostridium tepidiprofundi DSM 19306]